MEGDDIWRPEGKTNTRLERKGKGEKKIERDNKAIGSNGLEKLNNNIIDCSLQFSPVMDY